MFKGRCVTNIDELKHRKWPTTFSAIPKIGETVRSMGGDELKVGRIVYYEELVTDGNGFMYPEPRIEVELVKTKPIASPRYDL